MFVLNSDISIGRFTGIKPHSVKVEKSLFSYTDKATITLPISARIISTDPIVSKTVETAKQFDEGDRVSIRLGYNGSLNTEFVGFISRINFTQPLEIECEGYAYQLRKKSDYLKKTFKNVQLKDLLRYLIEGTDIVLADNIPDFPIEKFIIDGKCGTEFLEKIKADTHNTIVFFFRANVLFAGMIYLQAEDKTLEYLKPDHQVLYRLGWNVIKDGNLKEHQAKNANVTVKFIGEKKDGTKETVVVNGKKRTKERVVRTVGTAGDTGEHKTIKSHVITAQKSANLVANAKQEQYSYTGYEGKITAFLIPFCQPNWYAKIEDTKYKERSGSYLVNSTTVTYGMTGARRVVEIGKKIYE